MRGQDIIRLSAVAFVGILLSLLHQEWRLYNADGSWLPFWCRGK